MNPLPIREDTWENIELQVSLDSQEKYLLILCNTQLWLKMKLILILDLFTSRERTSSGTAITSTSILLTISKITKEHFS